MDRSQRGRKHGWVRCELERALQVYKSKPEHIAVVVKLACSLRSDRHMTIRSAVSWLLGSLRSKCRLGEPQVISSAYKLSKLKPTRPKFRLELEEVHSRSPGKMFYIAETRMKRTWSGVSYLATNTLEEIAIAATRVEDRDLE